MIIELFIKYGNKLIHLGTLISRLKRTIGLTRLDDRFFLISEINVEFIEKSESQPHFLYIFPH